MSDNIIILNGLKMGDILKSIQDGTYYASEALVCAKLETVLEKENLKLEPDAAVMLFNRAGGPEDKVPVHLLDGAVNYARFRLAQETLQRVVLAMDDGQPMGPMNIITKADVESFYAAGTMAQQYAEELHRRKMKELGILQPREIASVFSSYLQNHKIALGADAGPAFMKLLQGNYFPYTKDNINHLGYLLSNAALARAFNDEGEDMNVITAKDIENVGKPYADAQAALTEKVVKELIAGKPVGQILNENLKPPSHKP